MDQTEADKCEHCTPDRSLSADPSTGSPSPGVPWLDDFRDLLMTPAARSFVEWAAGAAGSRVVLDRSRFEPADLKPWIGDLSILQWDASAEDYRYRLFGSNWSASLGRDLTAQQLSAWPPKVARAIRARVRAVVSRRIPVGAHIVIARYVDGRLERGQSVFEEVMWPLSYGPGCGGAVLVLSARVPDKASLSAEILFAKIGRRSIWFSAA